MAKSSALKQQACNDQSALSSYSDLFEEFFKTDVQTVSQITESSTSFIYPEQQQQQQQMLAAQPSYFMSSFDPLSLQQQQQQQQQQMLAYLYAQQQPQYQLQQQHHQTQSYPVLATICKPGFARRPAKKSKCKNHTAQAAYDIHLSAAAAQMAPPFAREKTPIPAPAISPKSYPSTQPVSSPSARSAGTSEFVKHKLQQKIRARMIQKGQLPPNPTQEELRQCGVPLSPVPSVAASLVNSPKAPSQPTDLAAFVASTVTSAPLIQPFPTIHQPQEEQQQHLQQQQQQQQCNGFMNMNVFFNADTWLMSQPIPMAPQPSERDPLVQYNCAATASNQKLAAENTNYDDFFADFIQY